MSCRGEFSREDFLKPFQLVDRIPCAAPSNRSSESPSNLLDLCAKLSISKKHNILLKFCKIRDRRKSQRENDEISNIGIDDAYLDNGNES